MTRFEQENPEGEFTEKIVYFRRKGEQEQRAQELVKAHSLFGSDIFYKLLYYLAGY